MTPAFLQFSDPYSWLIRGMVEAEWQDLSLESYQVLPQKAGAGFDLRHLIQTGGRYGVRISIMAIDEHGSWFSEDQVYSFDIIFGQDNIGQQAYLVSSKDTGYSEFFALTPHSPLMAVEQLIERVQHRHVPQFINERKRGRTVTSNDINAMFTTRPYPADNSLLQFLFQRNQIGQTFNTAISEGLWFPQTRKGIFSESVPPQPSFQNQQPQDQSFQNHTQQNHSQQYQQNTPFQQDSSQQISSQNIPQNQGPMIQSGITAGGGMGALIREGNVVGDERGQSLTQLESPAKALNFAAFTGIAFGIAEFINSVLIFMKISSGSMVIPDKGHYFILFALHFMIALYCIFGGIASYMFNIEYRQIGNNFKAMFTIIYPATVPLCCIGGIPITIWGFLIWNKPEVKALRKA